MNATAAPSASLAEALTDGLLAFPLTPFTADGEHVAHDVLGTHIGRLLDAGPSAVFVACGTGEFTALGLNEYAEVVKTAVDSAGGKVPVFAGVGGGPALAREFAAAAVASGADGGLLLPPYLVRSTPDGLLRHVDFVASASQLPLMLYQRDTAVLNAPAAVSLLDRPTVIGIKDGLGDIERMQRVVAAIRTSGHPRARSFAFCNGLPTAELSARAYTGIGVGGYSSASLTFVPEIATAFYRALTSNDHETVDRLLAEFYLPFGALRDQVPGYAVALVKAGARRTGLDVGGVRPPLVDPGPEHLAELDKIIERGRAALR